VSPFELLEPASLDETLAALDASDPQVRRSRKPLRDA
jgi:hypothetical protein